TVHDTVVMHSGGTGRLRGMVNHRSFRSLSHHLDKVNFYSSAQAEDRFQFERHGYFVADRYDTQAGRPVFNRTVGLRDSWSQQNSPKGTQ
ncbi:MAG: glutamyl-trna synthetase, partial [Pseudomonadota bacterium]